MVIYNQPFTYIDIYLDTFATTTTPCHHPLFPQLHMTPLLLFVVTQVVSYAQLHRSYYFLSSIFICCNVVMCLSSCILAFHAYREYIPHICECTPLSLYTLWYILYPPPAYPPITLTTQRHSTDTVVLTLVSQLSHTYSYSIIIKLWTILWQ